jgi:AbrB family looped-hinge helix DNA binding protein
MNISKITEKGQTTIPAEIRHYLGISSGSQLAFVPLPDGTVLLKTMTDNLASLKGCLPAKRTVSLEEMEKAIRSCFLKAAWPGRSKSSVLTRRF